MDISYLLLICYLSGSQVQQSGTQHRIQINIAVWISQVYTKEKENLDFDFSYFFKTANTENLENLDILPSFGVG